MKPELEQTREEPPEDESSGIPHQSHRTVEKSAAAVGVASRREHHGCRHDPPQRPVRLALRRHWRLRTGISQLLYVLVAFGIRLTLTQVSIWFTVSSARAVDFLLAVGIGMVAFIGLIYSLLVLVIELGSTTFTPRLNLFGAAPIVSHAFSFGTIRSSV